MQAPGPRKVWFERIPAGVVSTLGFVLLGPLAGVLVLGAIPDAFRIESSCVTQTGAVNTEGDVYVRAFAVLGTLGWLAVFGGVMFASIVVGTNWSDTAELVPDPDRPPNGCVRRSSHTRTSINAGI